MRAALVAFALLGCRGDEPSDTAAAPATGCPPESWVTWDNFAEPLVTTWCLPCHSGALGAELRQGAPVGMDFDTYAGVAEWSDRMVDRISVRADMPPMAGPTPDERALFAEWAACGMPEAPPPATPAPCDTLTWIEGDASSDVCGRGNAVRGDATLDAAADLACLCEVEGDLRLTGAGDREAAELRAVGGSLLVEGGGTTRVILPKLASVGGAVRVTDNVALAELDLSALGSAGAEVEISRNALTALDVTRLATVGGDLRITDESVLDTVDLARADTIGGTLEVSRLPGLLVLRNTDTLRTIAGDLLVEEDGALALLGAFAGVTSVGGSVRVRATGLTNLDGFNDLTAIGGDLTISDNLALLEIAGFEALLTVGGAFDVRGNTALARVIAPGALTTVGGDVLFATDPNLLQLAGFESLTTIGGDLTLAALTRLTTLSAFPELATVGAILVTSDPVLTSVTGFGALEACSGMAFVVTPALVTLPDLPALHEIGDLEIDGTGVAHLNGFDSLRLIDGYVRIESNPALASVVGLIGVDTITGALTITDNPALPTAQANELAAAVDVQGPTDISGNAP